MCSRQAIVMSWSMLRACGVRGGPSDDESAALALSVWSSILDGYRDEELIAATKAHLADGDKSAWWPSPGAIVGRIHRTPRTGCKRLAGPVGVTIDALLDRGFTDLQALNAVAWAEFEPLDESWARARRDILADYGIEA